MSEDLSKLGRCAVLLLRRHHGSIFHWHRARLHHLFHMWLLCRHLHLLLRHQRLLPDVLLPLLLHKLNWLHRRHCTIVFAAQG